MTRVGIEGMDDVIRFLDNVPSNLEAVAKKAMRKANAATAKRIRGATPQRFAKLVTGKVVRARSTRDLTATVGLFNKHIVQGHQNPKGSIDDWFKAYWKNYGTLEGRDPSHQFDTPVKPARTAAAQRRRNRTGQRAENYFENGISGWEDVWISTFSAELEKQQDELYKR